MGSNPNDGRADLSLTEDIAEVKREIQKRANRLTAAYAEVAAAEADLADGEAQVAAVSPDLAEWIRAFRNPAAPNPPPVDPETAVTPEEGAPVFVIFEPEAPIEETPPADEPQA